MSTNNVHYAHIVDRLPDLHASLMDIVSVINSPEQDQALLELAGLSFERALFPLLVIVGRLGPIGVGDLAGRVGRDYSTVSRQVARLEALGLVRRRSNAQDARVREAIITQEGAVATKAVDTAREEMAISLFADWSRSDFDQLVSLMARLAQAMETGGPPGSSHARKDIEAAAK